MTIATRLQSARSPAIPILAVILATGVLSACGGAKDKSASQVAAKVNTEEISVHQINFLVQRQSGVRPDQAEAARRQALERLIDQELAVQKAEQLQLERDPGVLMALEAAKREVLARAYADRLVQAVSRPSREDVAKYYGAHPALFKERRVYQLQELFVEGKGDKTDDVIAALKAAPTAEGMATWLKKNDIRFAANQAVRAAEQLPLADLESLSKLRDGESLVRKTPSGLQVIVVAGSRSEPVDEARATPAIEQFLLNERKRDLLESERSALRGAAKIEYVGSFSNQAEQVTATPVTPAPSGDSTATDAPALDSGAISKGLKGLN